MRARWPIDRPIHALALAVEPNGLGARAKLKPSALRPPVTGRTFPSRTFPFDIVASLRRANLCQNCTSDRLAIAVGRKSDKFWIAS